MRHRRLNFANKFLLTHKLSYILKPSGLYTTSSNIMTFYVLRIECIYVFCMDLRTRQAMYV
jgi:hypothetical protein